MSLAKIRQPTLLQKIEHSNWSQKTFCVYLKLFRQRITDLVSQKRFMYVLYHEEEWVQHFWGTIFKAPRHYIYSTLLSKIPDGPLPCRIPKQIS